MSKKISPIISTNLRRFFDNKYGNFSYDSFKPCNDTQAANFLGYARDKYSKLQSKNDILLSTVLNFSIRLNINFPVLFSNEAEEIFSFIFGSDYKKDDYENYNRQLKMRSYKADFRLDFFIRNFIGNINKTLEKQNLKINKIYNPKAFPKEWTDVGNDDFISRSNTNKILRYGLCHDCNVSTLGCIALCCGYSWSDLAMLFVNNNYLRFSYDEGKMVVKDEYIDTYLLQPAE
ncbi:hypothetical protein [Schwartzia succinivorans]|uniref:Uncharacterized protein n=1 Tax=Schwartzia succinivorans DSM 10502 TaxID=1123243 RepID=A0A1M4YA88_9FIRM|nr:hypothetical protein [Schwartzia succinivorans]SHF02432.1 hypothetical protein SAMN02745190_01677 [Schwartzia succinivorans DSM 10502]